MANTDRPNGFKASKTLNGSPVAHMLRKLTVAARSDSTNDHGDIYIGDPVKVSVAGVVTVADSGDVIYGVCAGVGIDNVDHGDTGMFKADDLETRYLPDATAGFIWVYPKENMLFEIQSESDLDLTINAQADINLKGSGAAHGSQTTSQSNVELEADANSDVTVVELQAAPDNDTTLAFARYLVSIN
ncbi:MAG: hypothetical protein QQN63_10835 [Nitrosopumilus sp.]